MGDRICDIEASGCAPESQSGVAGRRSESNQDFDSDELIVLVEIKVKIGTFVARVKVKEALVVLYDAGHYSFPGWFGRET